MRDCPIVVLQFITLARRLESPLIWNCSLQCAQPVNDSLSYSRFETEPARVSASIGKRPRSPVDCFASRETVVILYSSRCESIVTACEKPVDMGGPDCHPRIIERLSRLGGGETELISQSAGSIAHGSASRATQAPISAPINPDATPIGVTPADTGRGAAARCAQ